MSEFISGSANCPLTWIELSDRLPRPEMSQSNANAMPMQIPMQFDANKAPIESVGIMGPCLYSTGFIWRLANRIEASDPCDLWKW